MTSTDPFAVLGVERRFALDRDALERRYRDLQRALHPDRHVDKAPSERRVSLERAIEVNEAYRVLKNDLSRAEALLRLAGVDTRHEGTRGDPSFLMEMMELREELGDARANRDSTKLARLRARVDAMRAKGFERLRAGLDSGSSNPAALLPELEQIRYYQRFLDEVDASEETA